MIRAIIVGVEHYPDAGASWDLDGPANDVLRLLRYIVARGVPKEAIRCLVSSLPRNAAVLERIGAEAGELATPSEAVLNHLFEDVLPDESADPLLLYWSGHGFMEQDGQRRLFTSDARPESKKNVNLNSLLDALDSTTFAGIRRVDAIIDTCANYIAATTAGVTDRGFTVGTRAAPREQRVLCGASAGEYALNLSAEQTGLFTKELMAIVEREPARDGVLFDFGGLLPALRERFAALRREGAVRQAPNLIWARADDVEETAPLPPVDGGDLFLSRLGVFEGSFSFLGCKAVYPRSRTLEVEAQVRRLRTGGLLLLHESVPRRYLLTSEARVSAKGRLAVLGEMEATRDRHAGHYVELTRTHELSLRSPARRGSLDLLEQELGNILQALDWCEARPALAEDGLKIASAMFWFWNLTGRFELGASRLSSLLDAAVAASMQTRAQAHYAAGALAFMLGQYEKACDLLERSRQFWAAQPLGDERDVRLAYVLIVLGRAQGTVDTATKNARHALKLFRTRGDRWGQALALNDLGYVLIRGERWKEALTRLTESLSLWRALGDPWGVPLTLNNLGLVQLHEQQAVAARGSHEEALAIQLEEGDAWGAAESLKYLGEVALENEDLAEARECFRASLFRLKAAPRPQIQIDCLLGFARLAAEARPLTMDAAAPIARALATWRFEVEKRGIAMLQHHDLLAKQLKGQLKNVLGDRFASDWERGKEMPLAEALAAMALS